MMKRIVFTLTLTVLLMTTLCISAVAQGTWTQEATFSSPSGGGWSCVEFVNNSTVIIGGQKSGEGILYRWNFDTGSKRSVTINSRIRGLAISGDTNYIMYSKADGNVGSRYTSDLDWRAGITTGFGNDPNFDISIGFSDPRYGYEHLIIGGTTSSEKAQYQRWKVATTPFTRLNIRTDNNRATVTDLETSKYVDEFFVADGDSNADIFGTDLSWEWGSGPADVGAYVTALAFNWETDSDRLAVGDDDGSIRIYYYRGSHLRNLGTGDTWGVESLDFSPTHWDILACVTWFGNVVVWDINGDGTILASESGIGSDVAFSPNGRYFASASTSIVRIWRNTGGLAAPSANPEAEKSPEVTTLLPNFPNPFNPETWIPYQLATPAEVTVSIHAADGKLVRTLELGQYACR